MTTQLKKVSIKGDKARIIGYDQPTGDIAFLNERLGYLVIKLKGYLAWSARSEQTYIPAHFQIYRIVMGDPGEYDFEVEHLFDFPLRKDTPRRVYREGHLKEIWNEDT